MIGTSASWSTFVPFSSMCRRLPQPMTVLKNERAISLDKLHSFASRSASCSPCMADWQLLRLFGQTSEADVMRSLDAFRQSGNGDLSRKVSSIGARRDSLQKRNVTVDGLLVVAGMLDCRVDSELEHVAVLSFEIVRAEEDVETLSDAVTGCGREKKFLNFELLARKAELLTSQHPVGADQCSAAESFLVAIENCNLPRPLRKCQRAISESSNVDATRLT